MAAQLASLPSPKVYGADGIVHINDLATADPDLLKMVVGASDPEAVVQRAVSTGARAPAVAQVSVDTAVTQLHALLHDATTRVVETTTDVLDHPGRGIAMALGSWKVEVASLLELTLDPRYRDCDCPVLTLFAVLTDRTLVAYNNDKLDPAALRPACASACRIVQREVRRDHDSVDLETVGKLIDEARRSLDRVSTIKRAHSAAVKKIGEASSQVAALNAEVSDTLECIEQALLAASRANSSA